MKSPTIARNSQPTFHRLMHVLAVLLLAMSCHDEPQEVTGGETHFLMACDPLAPTCDPGTACVCGICTRSCTETAMCDDLATAAACVSVTERPTAATCQDGSVPGYCDLRCKADKDCGDVSGDHFCESGFCRMRSSNSIGGNGIGGIGAGGLAGMSSTSTGGLAAMSSTSAGGALAGTGGVASAAAGAGGGSTACPDSNVSGNEVLILGDGFIAQSHQITAYLEELAREAGTLQTGERFRDYSTVTNSALAFGDTFIARQYAQGLSEGTSKVVLLCGGGADVLSGACPNPPTADCPTLVNAAQAANQLLAQMAKDAIEHVVWLFYPNPVDSGLAAKMDLLRPMVQKACESSQIPCHWIDLRPAFAGHYAEYIRADGITPTAAGAQASAAAIWATMQQACVAQ